MSFIDKLFKLFRKKSDEQFKQHNDTQPLQKIPEPDQHVQKNVDNEPFEHQPSFEEILKEVGIDQNHPSFGEFFDAIKEFNQEESYQPIQCVLTDKSKHYVIRIQGKHISPDDIQIDYDGNNLMIKIKQQSHMKQTGRNVISKNISGVQHFVFALDKPVLLQQMIIKSLNENQLEISIPKVL